MALVLKFLVSDKDRQHLNCSHLHPLIDLLLCLGGYLARRNVHLSFIGNLQFLHEVDLVTGKIVEAANGHLADAELDRQGFQTVGHRIDFVKNKLFDNGFAIDQYCLFLDSGMCVSHKGRGSSFAVDGGDWRLTFFRSDTIGIQNSLDLLEVCTGLLLGAYELRINSVVDKDRLRLF